MISKIIKKKGKFGIFFKRLLTLTDEPRLAYTNDGNNLFKKIIDLGEETKLNRINLTQFKINYHDRPTAASYRTNSTAATPEISITFKCNDAKECEEWFLKIR